MTADLWPYIEAPRDREDRALADRHVREARALDLGAVSVRYNRARIACWPIQQAPENDRLAALLPLLPHIVPLMVAVDRLCRATDWTVCTCAPRDPGRNDETAATVIARCADHSLAVAVAGALQASGRVAGHLLVEVWGPVDTDNPSGPRRCTWRDGRQVPSGSPGAGEG